jgi:hypothetical protein
MFCFQLAWVRRGEMKVKLMWFLFILCFVNLNGFCVLAEDVSFTLEDRDRLVRLEATLQEFKDSVDKRFEQVDKRFEQVDKRFEQMFHFLYILSGIFTALVGITIGFGYWDRRTMIREARREAIEFIEKEGILRRLMDALKDLSRKDGNLAEALRKYNLL